MTLDIKDRLDKRWRLLVRLYETRRDRVHPVDSHRAGVDLGFAADFTNQLVDELVRDDLVKRFSWQPGPVLLTPSGERAVEERSLLE